MFRKNCLFTLVQEAFQLVCGEPALRTGTSLDNKSGDMTINLRAAAKTYAGCGQAAGSIAGRSVPGWMNASVREKFTIKSRLYTPNGDVFFYFKSMEIGSIKIMSV